tara:strand:- start:370 stop:996 length:627 start_codon:yes stop_codon:yes gene_type:complete
MKVDIFNQSGKKLTKKVELNSKVFSVKPNNHSIYLTVKSELAAKRQGTSSSKTRAEVRGGGVKPWKQKGTGRARVGSTRNPSRVHGGIVFGPKPHSYDLKVNKKERNLARKSALSMKVSSNSFKVLDSLSLKEVKTKKIINILNNFDLDNQKTVILTSANSEELNLSCRNIHNVNLVSVLNFSTYDIVNSDFILFDKESIEVLNNKTW